MWAFKQLHDKGLVYEGFRCLPYCWNDETPLSAHELRMDEDVYQMRQDPAVTVGYRLETGELALIWTTTPWTLPSNLAMAVHQDVDYVVVESDFTGRTERYVLAEARLAAYARELGEDAATGSSGRCKGADLVGLRYTPPFSYFLGPRQVAHGAARRLRDHDRRHRHRAHRAGLRRGGQAAHRPVRDRARSSRSAPDGKFTCAGRRVRRDARLRRQPADHRPPQGPDPGAVHRRRRPTSARPPRARCCCAARPTTTPTRTAGGAVSRSSTWPSPRGSCRPRTIRDQMLELNEQITWVPEHVKHGQFGKWLENTRDWSISRNRFWGSPIPVWKSDDPAYPRIDVYGSLERAAGRLRRGGHRPAPARHRRADPAQPRRPDRGVGHAPGHRRAGLLVRVRLDVVRAGALPVRELGLVRAPLPRRLHRRVHRADPRLVLHHARDGVGAVRPARVRDLPQPRHRAGLRRAEDVQVAAQLPGRARGVRPGRRRRDALVPDVLADPARRQPDRHRAGHPRGRPPGAHPAVEQLVLLQPVRQRGGLRGGAGQRPPTTCSTSTCWPSCGSSSRRCSGSWTTTRSPTPATPPGRSWTCSPTGTSGGRGSGSGAPARRPSRWPARPSTPSTPRWRSPAGRRRRCCR